MKFFIYKIMQNTCKIIGLTVVFCFNVVIIATFAVTVGQNNVGIYCIKDNNALAINEWVEIDFEGDNYLEYYYFDSNGYLIMNSITPDGYTVNEKGQWIINSVVQHKYYSISNSNQNNNTNKKIIVGEETTALRIDSSNIIFIIIIIVFLFLIVILHQIPKNNNYYDYLNNNKLEHRKNVSISITKKKNINKNDTIIKRNIWWHSKLATDDIGDKGEEEVAEKLKYIGNEFIVLRNINFPRNNKYPVQIDFLCITDKGIFVIEVKNWLGIIMGNYEDENWYSKINDCINVQINPVKQNEWHIDVLRKNIKEKIVSIYSIVVFTDRSDICLLNKKYNNTYITSINSLNDIIYKIYAHSQIISYSSKYKNIAAYLRRFTVII